MADIGGITSPIRTMQNPLFSTPVGDKVPEEVNMYVENPKGSINKFEYCTFTGTIVLDRVLYEQIPYPVEYGCIPQTWDEDEDCLDIMSLINYPTFPGCLIKVRPIGVMMFIDTGEVDDKILAVPVDDIRFKNITDVSQVSEHQLDEIAFFFKHYKELQFKYKGKTEAKVEFNGWKGREDAYNTIKVSMERFKSKFNAQS